jgi:uncharacterized protein YuzE
VTARATFDREADAVYVKHSDQLYAFGEDIDHERRVDYAEDGTPIGIELLCVSEGVDLSNLPDADEVTAALRQLGIRVLV